MGTAEVLGAARMGKQSQRAISKTKLLRLFAGLRFYKPSLAGTQESCVELPREGGRLSQMPVLAAWVCSSTHGRRHAKGKAGEQLSRLLYLTPLKLETKSPEALQ